MRRILLCLWMVAVLPTAVFADDADVIKVGIIGLDTSHSIAFAKILNDPQAKPDVAGCRVVVAYPHGSPDIESSVSRIPKYTEEIQQLGVKIVDSIDELLQHVDVVLLETNDGRPHLEQARQVIAAGKPVFVDKPVAGSLEDAILMYREAERAGVPIFSSSSLRYGPDTSKVRAGALGRVQYAETFSPASIEKSHPDLFWYGIHGVESLYTVMGIGCQTVQRTTEDGKIVVTGKWDDGRVGIFREGKGYGGIAKSELGEEPVGSSGGYRPLLVEIVKFFKTGIAPVTPAETLELYAFMEAADESKRRNGAEVSLHEVFMKTAGYEPLFNGKDLTGWKGLVGNPKTRANMSEEELAEAQKKADEEMRAHWKPVDGVLAFDGKGKNLCTDKDYADFEMYVDWKIEPGGDSGIYLRGSPQVQIWDTEHEPYFRHGAENGSGSLWNNKKNPRFPSMKANRPAGEWNTMHIRMVGQYVTITLNGHVVTDHVVLENYWEPNRPIYRSEQIELQNHGNLLWFRNLYIREIGTSEANEILRSRQEQQLASTSIFNGEDFTGWKGDVDGYEVKDGTIVNKQDKGGNLLTEKQYANFISRLEFMVPPAGNNGLIVRYTGEGSPHINGMELQVLDNEDPRYAKLDPRQYHGSVYGVIPAHRGYLREPGEWNVQETLMNGNHIRIDLNGYTILDADLSEPKESKEGELYPGIKHKTGYFGFAGHKDPVAFRNISMIELPPAPATPPPRETAIAPEGEPIILFNGTNLEGFYTWIRELDYADPNKVFTVKDGILHISGNGYGGLITNESYRDYHLVIDFKWGKRTWGNREDRARDSGVLVHCWGPDGGLSKTWMASIEAQIIEGGTGDILVLSGVDPITSQPYPVSLTCEVTKDAKGGTVWKKGGERKTFTRGRINWWGRDVDWVDKVDFRGREDVESPFGEWTRMEVIADGDHLLYKVNGVIVNEGFEASPSSGKLLLQTEMAEMFVKRYELWPLGSEIPPLESND